MLEEERAGHDVGPLRSGVRRYGRRDKCRALGSKRHVRGLSPDMAVTDVSRQGGYVMT